MNAIDVRIATGTDGFNVFSEARSHEGVLFVKNNHLSIVIKKLKTA